MLTDQAKERRAHI